MKEDSLFLEVDVAQCCKEGQRICGDSFLTRRVEGEGRIIVVLSDGLGSGVKANVLSSMTASMALKFVEGKMEFLRSADVMMDALSDGAVKHGLNRQVAYQVIAAMVAVFIRAPVQGYMDTERRAGLAQSLRENV